MERTRSILKAMSVPNYFWGEAVRHATYLTNRVSTRALKNQTPYECIRGKNQAYLTLESSGVWHMQR